MSEIYVTVNHYDRSATAERPRCQGCTSEGSPFPEPADYQLVGASGTIDLCRRCVLHSIKSFAARFMMFDPRATRDLMDFFAANASKKRPAKKQPVAKKRRQSSKKVIDAVTPLLLEEKKSS